MKKYKEFLKSILITLITQAVLYFLIKIFITNYNTLNVKVNFPLIKEFIYIYNSWYPVVFLLSFLIYTKNKEIYYKLILSMIIGLIFSFITFLIYPSILERPVIEVTSLTTFILNLTYTLDTPAINCLPSIHCLYCFILIYYINIINNIKLKYKMLITLYLTLIILSTFFTKQHILIDAVLALIYGVITIILVKIFYKQIKRILNFIF